MPKSVVLILVNNFCYFRHVLDTLISLAKSFPIFFLPEPKEKRAKDSSGRMDHKLLRHAPYNKSEGRSSSKTENSNVKTESDFWDVLVKLDSLSTTSRKGKAILRNQNSSSGSLSNATEDESRVYGFESSPLAQLIGLLAHPVVLRSSVLTDRLLRLLALISLALPEPKSNAKMKTNAENSHEDPDSESNCMSPFHEDSEGTYVILV